MANIVCDLCGGAIRMQANQTGKCSECGMEYDLDAIRAKMGTPASDDHAPAPV